MNDFEYDMLTKRLAELEKILVQQNRRLENLESGGFRFVPPYYTPTNPIYYPPWTITCGEGTSAS